MHNKLNYDRKLNVSKYQNIKQGNGVEDSELDTQIHAQMYRPFKQKNKFPNQRVHNEIGTPEYQE